MVKTQVEYPHLAAQRNDELFGELEIVLPVGEIETPRGIPPHQAVKARVVEEQQIMRVMGFVEPPAHFHGVLSRRNATLPHPSS